MGPLRMTPREWPVSALGTVVELYTNPNPAYDVEFVNPDGSTRALLTLAPSQIRHLTPADVLTTRQLPLAA
jgi:hypothetical protein